MYYFMIIIYIFSSWIPPLREHKMIGWLERFVEPYLGIFRKVIPPIGGIDLSPILALFLLRYVESAFLKGLETVLGWIS
ncbi:YggT family protein [Pontibacillus sp. ALD_SL1]|uniref:YggT family protein n=1 Tax=Pontibacillus sp. ALD_SL1 TaxID=2777185 RepID=UPI00352FFD7C